MCSPSRHELGQGVLLMLFRPSAVACLADQRERFALDRTCTIDDVAQQPRCLEGKRVGQPSLCRAKKVFAAGHVTRAIVKALGRDAAT